MGVLKALRVPLGWKEVFKRLAGAVYKDNLFGWAAELAYYSFLALFPALLFFVALASFFPLHNVTDQIVNALAPFAPGDFLKLIRDQLSEISKKDSGGLLTIGIIGTIWSASSAMSSAISTLNQVYHVVEERSWWRVRATAVGLTIALAVFILISFALVLVGPTLIDKVADALWLGSVFRWTWKILEWPVVFALVTTGVGIVYYVAPDVKQEVVWLIPGSVFATIVWLIASLGFKWYVSSFADYQATYGAIGGVVVALLWLYVSALAILMGAAMNAIMEHSSPLGKDAGEKVPGEKEMNGGVAPHAAPKSARAGESPDIGVSGDDEPRRGPRPARPVRQLPPARPRPSDIAVGGIVIALEIAAIVAMRLRRLRGEA